MNTAGTEGLRAGLKENESISTFLYCNGEILAECDENSSPIKRHLQVMDYPVCRLQMIVRTICIIRTNREALFISLEIMDQ